MECYFCKENIEDKDIKKTSMIYNRTHLQISSCKTCLEKRFIFDNTKIFKGTELYIFLGIIKNYNLKFKKKCKFCKKEFSRIFTSGKLGCVHCYDTFKEDLKIMIYGKEEYIYNGSFPSFNSKNEYINYRDSLKTRMKDFAKQDNFEKAQIIKENMNKLDTKNSKHILNN